MENSCKIIYLLEKLFHANVDKIHFFIFFKTNLAISIMDNIVTRERAICIFFCQEYTESNVRKLLKRMESFEDVDICYEENPFKPCIQSNARIESEPSRYKKYTSTMA